MHCWLPRRNNSKNGAGDPDQTPQSSVLGGASRRAVVLFNTAVPFLSQHGCSGVGFVGDFIHAIVEHHGSTISHLMVMLCERERSRGMAVRNPLMEERDTW